MSSLSVFGGGEGEACATNSLGFSLVSVNNCLRSSFQYIPCSYSKINYHVSIMTDLQYILMEFVHVRRKLLCKIQLETHVALSQWIHIRPPGRPHTASNHVNSPCSLPRPKNILAYALSIGVVRLYWSYSVQVIDGQLTETEMLKVERTVRCVIGECSMIVHTVWIDYYQTSRQLTGQESLVSDVQTVLGYRERLTDHATYRILCR